MFHQQDTMVGRSAPRSSTGTIRRTTAATLRPPIVLEITPVALIAGRVGGLPKHTEPLLGVVPHNASVEALYRYYVVPIRAVLRRVASTNASDTFVLVLSKEVIPSRMWETAIAQCLLDDFCTALSFVSTLHTIPVALAIVSSTIWAIEINDHNTMQCMITADDHPLEFTYQSADSVEDWPRALTMTLLQCPLSHRKFAVKNMAVIGGVGGLSNKLARALYSFLEQGPQSEEDDPAECEKPETCYYAIDTTPLKALAQHITIQECQNRSLAWLGASIWASRKAHDPSCWMKSVPES